MAQLLDDSAIDDALVSLPGWQRVDNTLVKDVPVDGAAADDLEAAVAKAADELNHHPVVDRSDGATAIHRLDAQRRRRHQQGRRPRRAHRRGDRGTA